MKRFSKACEQNKEPLLEVVGRAFVSCQRVLEIGSGTGQHAVFFGRHMPLLSWQTSDLPEHHASIYKWIEEAELGNVLPPITLDVEDEWPAQTYDGVFSANTAHIMSWPQVIRMFAGVARVLQPGGVFCLYGPFKYDGDNTCGNDTAAFDQLLQAQDPVSGIRDFEKLDKLARCQGLVLVRDEKMPANNRALIWCKPAYA